jgi:hypothetical protein
MKIKVSFEDRTVCNVETYIKIDNVECEIDELFDLLDRLEVMDVPVSCSRLKDKLLKLEVIQPSKFKAGYFHRSKKYAEFAEKIQNKFEQKRKRTKSA